MLKSSMRLLLCCLTLALAAVTSSGADFRLEKELTLSPGGTFELDTDLGRIEVRGTSRSGARVVVTSTRDDIEDRVDFSFEEGSDRVTVKADKRGRWNEWFGWRGETLHFEIEVPHDTALELSTSGGRIDIEDVAGTVDASTSGGAISASDLGGDARLHTSGGAIAVERVAGDLTAKTSGGGIRIEGAGGHVLAATSGGSRGDVAATRKWRNKQLPIFPSPRS